MCEGRGKVMEESKAREAYVWNAMSERAHDRADRSEDPQQFMKVFQATLTALLTGGDNDSVERRVLWSDSTFEAAEIEALCAYRALQHWGTGQGLCVSFWQKKLVQAV